MIYFIIDLTNTESNGRCRCVSYFHRCHNDYIMPFLYVCLSILRHAMPSEGQQKLSKFRMIFELNPSHKVVKANSILGKNVVPSLFMFFVAHSKAISNHFSCGNKFSCKF